MSRRRSRVEAEAAEDVADRRTLPPGTPLGAINWPKAVGWSAQQPRRESYLQDVDGTLTAAGRDHAAANPDWTPWTPGAPWPSWEPDLFSLPAPQGVDDVKVSEGLL